MTEPSEAAGAGLAVFLPCAPALEPLVLEELSELEGVTLSTPRAVAGGVELGVAGWADVWALNLRLAIPLAVMVRVASFSALRMPELRRKAGNVAWGDWLAPGTRVAVRARTRKSKLYHTGAVAARVAEALAEFGCEVDASADLDADLGAEQDDGATPAAHAATDAPAPLGIHVRVDHDTCTLSIDSSGAPLHRRGYRLAVGKAPLREDLAAALVRASGWDRRSPLLDPLAGSGTVAIEAGLLAQRLAPGRLRAFAFEVLPNFDAAEWARVREVATALERPPVEIRASDRDSGVISMSRANAERAGVAVTVRHCAIKDADWDGGEAGPLSAVVTNPPYGHRVGKVAQLRDLYATFGTACRGLPVPTRIGVVATDRRLVGQMKLSLEPRFATQHGGLRITYCVGQAGGA